MRNIVTEDEEFGHMPDYTIRIDEKEHQVVFQSRGSVPLPDVGEEVIMPPLDPDVYDMARQAAPGWDVRMIEAEWRSWATEVPRSPEMAFLGFCRKWFEKRGRP